MSPDPHDRLAERIAPGARVLRRWTLHGGVSASVEALELALPDGTRHRVVLRRHGAADWKPLDADVTAKEHRVLQALHAAGLPVPEPLLLDDTGTLLPSPFLVIAWIDGTTVVPDDASPPAVEQMAAFLAALHALDPVELGLDGLPAREDPVEGALSFLPEGAPSAWRAHLSTRGPLAPVRPRVLHGDYWPGNVLWHDGRIAAVLDWEDAAVGDPLSDVAAARLELLHACGPEGMERFTRAWLGGSAVDRERLAVWELYVATAMLASIHHWGLPAEREARMRRHADEFAREAAAVLVGREEA